MRNSGNFTRIRVGGSGSRVGRRDKLEWTTGNLNLTSSIVDANCDMILAPWSRSRKNLLVTPDLHQDVF